MIRLAAPIIILAVGILVAVAWASFTARLARLEREIADLRSEVLFLRAELSRVQGSRDLERDLEDLLD